MFAIREAFLSSAVCFLDATITLLSGIEFLEKHSRREIDSLAIETHCRGDFFLSLLASLGEDMGGSDVKRKRSAAISCRSPAERELSKALAVLVSRRMSGERG